MMTGTQLFEPPPTASEDVHWQKIGSENGDWTPPNLSTPVWDVITSSCVLTTVLNACPCFYAFI